MGVEQVLVAHLPVAEHGAPERQYICRDERVDRYQDPLQAGQIDGDAQFARRRRDLPAGAEEGLAARLRLPKLGLGDDLGLPRHVSRRTRGILGQVR